GHPDRLRDRGIDVVDRFPGFLIQHGEDVSAFRQPARHSLDDADLPPVATGHTRSSVPSPADSTSRAETWLTFISCCSSSTTARPAARPPPPRRPRPSTRANRPDALLSPLPRRLDLAGRDVAHLHQLL